MSLYSSFLSDEQFQCSICLDLFNNPSSTPCGHSFCMGCISRYWDGCKVCQCPLCKKNFQKRPDLQINRTLREITEQFKSMKGGGGGGPVKEKRGGRVVGVEGGIPGSVYEELKKKLPHALLPTDAQSHNGSISATLSPDSRSGGRRRFTVTGAANSHNLPLCDTHRRGILIYCRTDHMCVCPICASEDHHDHDTLTIEAEWMERKVQLGVSEQQIKEMIRERIRKMEEIRLAAAELEKAVQRETAGSMRLFSTLVSAVERSQAKLMEVVEMNRRAAQHQADSALRQLELEVEELRRRESALAQLGHSEDHIHCVKMFPTISSPPPARDWTGVSVNSDLGTRDIYRSVVALVQKFQEELNQVAETGFPAPVLEPSPVRTQPRTKKIQEYALDVTLDGDTAHPRLLLSDDLKSVRCGERHQLLPDNPERFDRVVCVLGREAISSGRHYWEVEVGGKTDWDLGVAKHSVNRKGKIQYTPCNGFWFLSLRDKSTLAFRTEPSTDVHMNLPPNKIGVFVDFEKGQVSFYNVDAKIHIYTFNDIFNESIYPFFSPCTNKSGKNDGPLVITPVNVTE
uniref:Bloodthirsty-related gene family, member 1 n=1 Tax=Salarias fasciatus TaxID=181472 RepID=A0A672JCB6_SALFA